LQKFKPKGRTNKHTEPTTKNINRLSLAVLLSIYWKRGKASEEDIQ